MEQNFIKICIKKWRWFATSVTTTLLIGILVLLTTAPQYERSATILVKDENGGNGLLSSMSAGMGMLAGIGRASSSVPTHGRASSPCATDPACASDR